MKSLIANVCSENQERTYITKHGTVVTMNTTNIDGSHWNNLQEKVMFKRSFVFLPVIALVPTSAFSGIDEIVIFNEQVAWCTADAAKKATDRIVKMSNRLKALKFLTRFKSQTL